MMNFYIRNHPPNHFSLAVGAPFVAVWVSRPDPLASPPAIRIDPGIQEHPTLTPVTSAAPIRPTYGG